MKRPTAKKVPDTRAVKGLRTTVEPHEFERAGWRRWLCRYCYAPKKLHPRTGWVRLRPLNDHTYLSVDAPHFDEGW